MYEPYADYMREVERKYGIMPNLLLAIRQGETGAVKGDPRTATSSAGAQGYMQFMPETGARYGLRSPADFNDPYKSIDAAGQYVRDIQQMYPGRPDLVAAAYNAGEHNKTIQAGKVPQNGETEKYVPKVMHVFDMLNKDPNMLQNPSSTVGVQPPQIGASKPVPYPNVTLSPQRAPQPQQQSAFGQNEVGAATEGAVGNVFKGKGQNVDQTAQANNPYGVPMPEHGESYMVPGFGSMGMARAGAAGTANPGYEDAWGQAPSGLMELIRLIQSGGYLL